MACHVRTSAGGAEADSGQGDRIVPLEEAGVGGAGQELSVAEDADEQVPVGGHAVDASAGQGGGEAGRPPRIAPGAQAMTLASMAS